MKSWEMKLWVIYERPKDYPDHFVVRRWTVDVGRAIPEKLAALATTLEEARDIVPDGLHCIPRHESDDPCIVEVWA